MIFFKNEVLDERTVAFEAIEDGVIVGKCTLLLNGSYADVTELSYSNDVPYAAEGLLRSAYNYAGLRNYYAAKCSTENIFSLLEKMSFKKIENEYVSDIPTILLCSCSK